ncbi:vacuolar protein sorting 29 [Guillardia theta CCMP2712]|uniref:Vacuolar protein sorting-associated protein 29 n=2 Tax=Guillardia theta TaxID=55529 RepID=L1J1U9_GUITC|nr:vacuolar protein sorting 29 [Guillardia theta CCMP2712]EKX42491.1 vacuolar protein sorting 29 [Guillardia theta CCMP2712]|eukprot:XP_005829471.1 vacuolar protein sorting 29 [Guillardia theta CCMP2712]
MLVLAVGDALVPGRAGDIPAKFRRLLVPEKIEGVLCTGNLSSKEMQEYFRSLSSDLHIVKGDFDEGNYPETKVVNIHNWKIGLCHGHQVVPWGDQEALAMLQRQLDVDVLITGHTHKYSINVHEEKLYINPGSITGAYSGMTSNVTPSFVLLDIQDSKLTIYVYELQASSGGEEMELKVQELKHSK